MLGQSSFSQAFRSFKFIGLLTSLVALSACTDYAYIPSDTDGLSGDPKPDTQVSYDKNEFDNTKTFDIPENNLKASIPSVQATLSQNATGLYKGSKTQKVDIPPYIIIEFSDINTWRYATVQSPEGGRTMFAEYDRLPISKSVPTGSYIVVRPLRKVYGDNPDPKNPNPEAYLFQVLANATAQESAGNLLTVESSTSAVKNEDWVVPIDLLDFSQVGISSIIGKNGEISVISIAPDRYYGMSGQYAIIQGGVTQGLNVGETMIAHGSRVKGNGGTRAIRDGREIKPEGNGRIIIVQATNSYALGEIHEASQPIGEGDVLLPVN